ncbi:MAG: class I SAM-dependent methyltransferase [Parcubacteria group bacterium]|nr:class I SAM-dependent methyltransferase [Parcubacteria group bacterium]
MSKWPKKLPELTLEQKRIKNDFMKYWHEVLPHKYGMIERFNHGFPVEKCRPGGRVLEIGAGLGEHIAHEDRVGTDYYALEILPHMAAIISERFADVHVITGDCQEKIDFPDSYFDRVIAIHVLEHLPNLPAAVSEVRRVLKPSGEFAVVIPCEGGLAYSFARRISARRIFEKRYGVSYGWCIGSEHINVPREIFEEIEPHFEVVKKSFFPFILPIVTINLVIGLILKPRQST